MVKHFCDKCGGEIKPKPQNKRSSSLSKTGNITISELDGVAGSGDCKGSWFDFSGSGIKLEVTAIQTKAERQHGGGQTHADICLDCIVDIIRDRGMGPRLAPHTRHDGSGVL